MRKRIGVLLMSLGLFSCSTYQLTQEKAIELAENYVLDSGYATRSDNPEHKNSSEGFLEPTAVFVIRGLRRWQVGFQNSKDSTRLSLIRIYGNGKRIVLVHQDLRIISKEKL